MNDFDNSSKNVHEELVSDSIVIPPEDEKEDLRIHFWLRVIVFLQFLTFAGTYLYIWYYPCKAEVGTFVWRPNIMNHYFLFLGIIVIIVGAVNFIIPALKKSLSGSALFVSSTVCIFITGIFLVFLFIFVATTIDVTGVHNFRAIDPFPFLRWARFLIFIA